MCAQGGLTSSELVRGCVWSLSCGCVCLCVSWTWELGGPRSDCVGVAWAWLVVARGPIHLPVIQLNLEVGASWVPPRRVCEYVNVPILVDMSVCSHCGVRSVAPAGGVYLVRDIGII